MDGFSAKQHQFVACLRELGGASGNKSLRERLHWSERDYFTVQAELVVSEVVQRGKGRGGSVVLLDTSAVLGPAGALDERSLYEPLRVALPRWIEQHYGPQSFVWLKPETVGSKGGTKVGGRWRRTDLAAASVRRFAYSPTILVDTFAFEVKSIANLDVAAIYETAENSAGATYGYLLVHQSLREERRSQGALFLRLRRQAEEGIDFAFVEELRRADIRTLDPLDILGGIETDIGNHEAQQHIRDRRQGKYTHPPALQIGNAADAVVGDQFKTAGVKAGQHLDRQTGFDRG